MPPKMSIFIPVYKESENLELLLEYLLSDPYAPKEVFVIIDEPTEKSLKAIARFENSINFILNGKRKGKVNVLNEAVKESDGEILLFLDSDVQIPPNRGNSFLQIISEAAMDAEIVEVKKKVIRDSFLAKVVHYDYLGFSVCSLMFSKMLGKCLGLNGAAFAIKKKTFESLGGFQRVVSEDLDLGIRSFIGKHKFKFIDKSEVYVNVSPSWRQWFNQRKRWGIGAALWLKAHIRELLACVRMHPEVLLPSLLMILPSFSLFMISMFMPNELYFNLLSLLLLLSATKGGSFLYPPLLLASSAITLLRALTLFSIFFAYLLAFFFLSRVLDYEFEPLSFTFFYLVYSPVWFLILVLSIIKVCISDDLKIDWKV